MAEPLRVISLADLADDEAELVREAKALPHISNRYGWLRNRESELYARLHELHTEEFEVREEIQRVGAEMTVEYAKWRRAHQGE